MRRKHSVVAVRGHAVRIGRWVALSSVAVLAGGLESRAKDPDPVVNCFDADRRIVQKTPRSECAGQTLNDREAARIADERQSYVRQAIGSKPNPTTPKPPHDKRATGVGSGIFVSGTGHVLTNYHIIADCTVLTVIPASAGGREELRGSVVAARPGDDLAILRTSFKPQDVARFSTADRPPLDQNVSIVGYPDQGIPPIKPLLTEATVAGFRTAGSGYIIEIKGDIRPGNSGGPVLNSAGDVIGVVFAKIDTPGVYRRTGKIVRDLGFAIPTRYVTRFLRTHKVAYQNAHKRAAAATNALTSARRYVARIDCGR